MPRLALLRDRVTELLEHARTHERLAEVSEHTGGGHLVGPPYSLQTSGHSADLSACGHAQVDH